MDKLDDVIFIRHTKKPEDEACIANHWVNSHRYGNSYFLRIEDKVYYPLWRNLIAKIMNNPATKYKIACLKEDEDVILGFSVSDDQHLHWVYVNEKWRGNGLGKLLLPDPMPQYASHINDFLISIKKLDLNEDGTTKTIKVLKRNKPLPFNLKFNPFLL